MNCGNRALDKFGLLNLDMSILSLNDGVSVGYLLYQDLLSKLNRLGTSGRTSPGVSGVSLC